MASLGVWEARSAGMELRCPWFLTHQAFQQAVGCFPSPSPHGSLTLTPLQASATPGVCSLAMRREPRTPFSRPGTGPPSPPRLTTDPGHHALHRTLLNGLGVEAGGEAPVIPRVP